MNPRVAVGITLYGYVPSFVYWRHLGWVAECTMRGHIRFLLGSEDCYIPGARRKIVLDAREAGATHLFFLDQDVIVPADTIPRLLAHDKDIVGALYYQKVRGHTPVAGRFSSEPPGWEPMTVKTPLQKCEVMGLGSCLINMSVFDRVGDDFHWFDMNAEVGEDILFFKRVKDAGIQPWIDTTIETFHVGATPINYKYLGVNSG